MIHLIKGISKNPAFYGLNPSPFSGREGYKEFLETPLMYLKHRNCLRNRFLNSLPAKSAQI